MIRRLPKSPAERVTTIVVVVALHFALLLLLLSLSAVRDPVKTPQRPMAMVNVSASQAPAAAKPPPPATRSKLALKIAPIAPPSVSDTPAPPAVAGAGCNALEVLTTAVNADPAAVTAVQSAPPELRSVVGAVAIWNAGWIPGADAPDAPLMPVRIAIENGLRTLDPTCLNEALSGPRFIIVPAGDHSLFVVLGSINWTWAQLLLPPDQLPPQAAQPLPDNVIEGALPPPAALPTPQH